MSLIRTFTRQELEALGLPDKIDRKRVLLDEFFEEHRWEIEHHMVFRSPDDEQTYSIYYRTPTTIEGEDNDPWNDQATVEGTIVELRTVFRQEWRPAGSEPRRDEAHTNLDDLIRTGLDCAVCQTRIDWIDAPTGGWWAHLDHPDDNHDAVSVIWGTDAAPWSHQEG